MNYTELVRENKRLLRMAKKDGLPQWAIDHVEETMRRAAHARSYDAGKEHRRHFYEKAVRLLCESQSMLLAYRNRRPAQGPPRPVEALKLVG